MWMFYYTLNVLTSTSSWKPYLVPANYNVKCDLNLCDLELIWKLNSFNPEFEMF